MRLSKIELFLLSALCNDREPLHSLYSDATAKVKQVSVLDIIDSLLQLTGLGLASCYLYDDVNRQYSLRVSVSREALLQHCAGRTSQELREWPADCSGGEYFFEITPKGRREEADEAYAPYYADSEK